MSSSIFGGSIDKVQSIVRLPRYSVACLNAVDSTNALLKLDGSKGVVLFYSSQKQVARNLKNLINKIPCMIYTKLQEPTMCCSL